MHNSASNRCLDVNSNTTTTGTQLQIWDCNGGTNQSWTRDPSGQLSVYNGSSMRCADASGQGTSPGTKAIIWTCNGQTNQQWTVNSDGTITGVQSGLCLDARQLRHRQRHPRPTVHLQRSAESEVDPRLIP